MVLKDGIYFDVSDPTGGEDSIEGACGFGPSPESAVPHNMFELEVLFDGSDPTLAGHSHGQYSPDPSHWGAGLPTDPGQTQDPTCTLPSDPNCNAANDPEGGGFPTTVPCPPGGPGQGQDPDIRFSFGEEVSNACVNVVRGSGGTTLVTEIPFPQLSSVPTLSQWGLILFGLLLLSAGFLTIRWRRLPTRVTASLLVLVAAGVVAVGSSYAQIQSSRSCGENEVAVEFVNDLLNG